MNELHLFAGAGGGILGGILLGHTTVCAVEIEPYCRKVLLQRQRDGILPKFPIWDDVRTFDGKPWMGKVDIVCGGFPCQDISSAGKGAGIEGERSGMWVEMARIIGEIRPQFAFVENSPMLTSRGLGRVLGDLAEMGYDARWGVVGAHHTGAPHKRDRIWILAADSNVCGRNDGSYTKRQYQTDNSQVGTDEENQQSGSVGQYRFSEDGCDVAEVNRPCEFCGFKFNHDRLGKFGCPNCEGEGIEELADSTSTGLEGIEWTQFKRNRNRPSDSSENLANADSKRFAQLHNAAKSTNQGQLARCDVEGWRETQWWTSEPNVGRVAHGVASRVDRLKAIGNGQVSIVAATAFNILTKEL